MLSLKIHRLLLKKKNNNKRVLIFNNNVLTATVNITVVGGSIYHISIKT